MDRLISVDRSGHYRLIILSPSTSIWRFYYYVFGPGLKICANVANWQHVWRCATGGVFSTPTLSHQLYFDDVPEHSPLTPAEGWVEIALPGSSACAQIRRAPAHVAMRQRTLMDSDQWGYAVSSPPQQHYKHGIWSGFESVDTLMEMLPQNTDLSTTLREIEALEFSHPQGFYFRAESN